MGIRSNLGRLHMLNRMSQSAGRIGNGVRGGIGVARALGGEARRRFVPGERERFGARENVGVREKFFRPHVDEEVFESRNARNIERENIKREQRRIIEALLKARGLSGTDALVKARRNRRLMGMVKVIHGIFGARLNEAEIIQVNKILQNNLHREAQFLNSSPELQKAVKIIAEGRPTRGVEQAINVLTQASVDILQNDEVGQRIMQSHGLM